MEKEVKIGDRFGHLIVIQLHNDHHKGKSWICHCDCGNKVIKHTSRLLGLNNRRPDKSCGCFENTQNGNAVKYPRIYSIWKSIQERCYIVGRDNYERYGGKGITVCDEWLDSFDTFLKWSLENGYSDDLNFNRIDVKGNYEPSNCRWADVFTQMQNRGMLKSNTSGVNGVTYSEKRGTYRAYLTRKKVRKYLGSFKTLEKAEEARLKAEEHYKKFGTIEDL